MILPQKCAKFPNILWQPKMPVPRAIHIVTQPGQPASCAPSAKGNPPPPISACQESHILRPFLPKLATPLSWPICSDTDLQYLSKQYYFFYNFFMEISKNKQFMNRNVTEFQHLITPFGSTENDLNWVMGLRENGCPPKMKHTTPTPPEVFFKSTTNSKFRVQQRSKKNKSSIIPNQYDHIYLKGKHKHNQTQNQIIFYNSLRKDKDISQSNQSLKNNFSTIPFKERGGSPKLIKKEFTKKIKNITKADVESGLDGAQNYKPYTQKILKVKNYGFLSSFTKAKGRSQVSLPQLAWQVGLRDYR